VDRSRKAKAVHGELWRERSSALTLQGSRSVSLSTDTQADGQPSSTVGSGGWGAAHWGGTRWGGTSGGGRAGGEGGERSDGAGGRSGRHGGQCRQAAALRNGGGSWWRPAGEAAPRSQFQVRRWRLEQPQDGCCGEASDEKGAASMHSNPAERALHRRPQPRRATHSTRTGVAGLHAPGPPPMATTAPGDRPRSFSIFCSPTSLCCPSLRCRTWPLRWRKSSTRRHILRRRSATC
jgi:hypothetical protein